MPARKPQTRRPPDDPAEYQRFLDMAEEVEADEDAEAMDRAFSKIDPFHESPSPRKPAPGRPKK